MKVPKKSNIDGLEQDNGIFREFRNILQFYTHSSTCNLKYINLVSTLLVRELILGFMAIYMG